MTSVVSGGAVLRLQQGSLCLPGRRGEQGPGPPCIVSTSLSYHCLFAVECLLPSGPRFPLLFTGGSGMGMGKV